MRPAPAWLSASLESAINAWLRLDPEAMEDMAALASRVLALEIVGPDLLVILLPGEQGLQVLGHYEGEPDTVLSGTPLAFVRMGMAENAGDHLLQGDISLRGDTSLGQRFRKVLERVDVDWEDLLARFTGDVVAHGVGQNLRSLGEQARRGGDRLAANSAEYLTEELRVLATPAGIEEFNNAADELRLRADRLQARLQRLEQMRGSRS